MRRVLILFLSMWGLIGCSQTATQPEAKKQQPVSSEWKLVWSDEFDGTEIDTTKWNFEVTGWGGGNQELQYYTNFTKETKYGGITYQPNAYVKDGKLHLVTHKEEILAAINNPWEGSGLNNAPYEPDFAGEKIVTRQYTSARLNSAKKGDWKYGRIEGRMTLPSNDGMWPAFWMLPTNWEYGTWPQSGEIDIHEWSAKGGRENEIFGTLHYGKPHQYREHLYPIAREKLKEYHTYALEWEPGEIRWYFDGVLYQTQNKDGKFILNHKTGEMEQESNRRWFTSGPEGTASDCEPYAKFPAPFDKEFHILLNVAVGGNLGGFQTAPLTGTLTSGITFPQEMVVDYIRVYQKPVEEKVEEPLPKEICNKQTGDIRTEKVADKNGTADVARQLTYLGKEGGAQYYLQTKGTPQNFSAYESLKFDVKVLEAPNTTTILAIDCVYPCRGMMDLQDNFTELEGKGWQEVSLNLEEFSVPQLSRVNTAFLLFIDGSMKIQIANIRYETADGTVKKISVGTDDEWKPAIMGKFNQWAEVPVE